MDDQIEQEPEGTTQLQLNNTQVHSVPVEYSTIADVSFDGFNFHLAFFVTTPEFGERPTPSTGIRTQAIARIVMTELAAQRLLEDLERVISNPVARGIFVDSDGQNVNSNGDEEVGPHE